MSITVKDLTYTYMPKSPFAKQALKGVSILIEEGDFLGIIGKTGSGKSTFIQHLNALIRLQNGELKVCDIDLSLKKPDLKKLRSKVGMVMQYPEYQLFEETVEKDVMFGPLNIGVTKEEAALRAKEALTLVGLDYDAVKGRSPFELSGGQKRRAAIAGVIAMHPEVLVLDEPTAGLDPKGKKEILALIAHLKQTTSHTVIMISHDMDTVAACCSRVALFNDGKIVMDGTPQEVFYDDALIKQCELELPCAVSVAKALVAKGVQLKSRPVTATQLAEELLKGRLPQ